jgi:drug/metabolite transporter (DMT)-like permease
MELPLESQPAARDRAHLNRGYTLGLIGIAFWSTTAIFISYLLKNYPLQPLTLAFWRDVFVVSALTIILVIFRRSALHIDPSQRKFLLLYGVSLTLMNISWTLSVAQNGAAVSTVMVYASPGITAIAAHFFFKERISSFACWLFWACSALLRRRPISRAMERQCGGHHHRRVVGLWLCVL